MLPMQCKPTLAWSMRSIAKPRDYYSEPIKIAKMGL